METRANYVIVGIFVLSAIILAFIAVLYLSHIRFGQTTERYYIFFKGSVQGLNKGSQVQYNGIPIGRVIDVRVDPANLGQIQVEIEVDTTTVPIKSDARAYLDTNLLNDIATIQIRGGTQEAPLLAPRPGHKYAEIPPGRTALEEVQARLPELVADLKRAADGVNALLDRPNREAVTATLHNLETVSGNLVAPSRKLDEIADNANKSVVQLNALLQNTDHGLNGRGGLKDQASQTLGDYDKLARSLNANSRQIQEILAENRSGIRDFTQRTLPAIDGFVGNAQRFLYQINRFTTEIEQDPTRLLFGDRRHGYTPQ
jgi:phospholipid/cholesterol/gamma-HCH transport system substrate-binding protein